MIAWGSKWNWGEGCGWLAIKTLRGEEEKTIILLYLFLITFWFFFRIHLEKKRPLNQRSWGIKDLQFPWWHHGTKKAFTYWAHNWKFLRKSKATKNNTASWIQRSNEEVTGTFLMKATLDVQPNIGFKLREPRETIDYCCFELEWIQLALGCFLTILWIGFNFHYIEHFVGVLLCRLTGHSTTAMHVGFKVPSSAALEVEPKGFWDDPPNANRKSRIHWLVLNGTSLCIMWIWGKTYSSKLGGNRGAHELTFHYSSAVGTLRPTIYRFTPLWTSSWIKQWHCAVHNGNALGETDPHVVYVKQCTVLTQ